MRLPLFTLIAPCLVWWAGPPLLSAAPASVGATAPVATNPENPANTANPGNAAAAAAHSAPVDGRNAITGVRDTQNEDAAASVDARRPELSDRFPAAARSDAPDPTPLRPIALSRFLDAVLASNLDLAAQRFSVKIAEAQLIAARVSPNPTLSVGGNHDLTNRNQVSSYNVGMTELVEMGGKRGYRTDVAIANLLTASANLEDFLRTLRGTAGSAYVDALFGELTVKEKRRAYESLNKLANVNQLRFSAGDLAQVDYNQARVDALQARGDLYSAQSTARTSLYALLQFLGKPGAPLPKPVGQLEIRPRHFDLAALLARAQSARPDVLAARSTYKSSQAALRLARANRFPDLTGGVAVQENDAVHNPIDPAPSFNSLNLSISIPLPLFNTLRGEYLAALNTSAQAERTLRSVELKAEVDVRGSSARYAAAREQVAQYQGGALQLAEKVLETKLNSYKLGSATLLDVLNAQKADTDVHLAALAALSERAKALIALEQAAYLWDIDF